MKGGENDGLVGGRGGDGDQLVCFVHIGSVNSGNLFVRPLPHRAQDVSENLLQG